LLDPADRGKVPCPASHRIWRHLAGRRADAVAAQTRSRADAVAAQTRSRADAVAAQTRETK